MQPAYLIFIVLWSTCGSLFCVFSCLSCCKYIIRWEDSFIQTRHPKMNVLIAVVIFFVELWFQPMSCLGDLHTFKDQNWINFINFSRISLQISHHLLFFAVLVQFYAFYYDTRCSLASESIGWKELLQSNPSDWYLENKNTFGNYRYYCRALIGYIIIQIATRILVFAYSRDNLIYLDIPIICAFLGICMIAWYRPDFNDELWVRPQMTYLMISWSLVTVVVVSRVLGSKFISSGRTKNIFIIAMYVCINITYFLFLWFLLDYPLYKKKSNKIITGVNEWNRRKSHHARTLSKHLQLSDTTSDEVKLSDFMNHLMSEYAHELLLFLIEYSLYKQYLIEKFTIQELRRTLSVSNSKEQPAGGFDTMLHAKQAKSEIYKVDLPNFIKCEIVSNDTKYEGFERKGKALYDKYIPNDAKFQLNLSYETAQKLRHAFEPSRMLSSGGYDFLVELSRTLSDIFSDGSGETNSSGELILKKKSNTESDQTIKTPKGISPRPGTQQPDLNGRSNAHQSKSSLSKIPTGRNSASSKLTAYLQSQTSAEESARDSVNLNTPRTDNRQLSVSQASVISASNEVFLSVHGKQNTNREEGGYHLSLDMRSVSPSAISQASQNDDGASILLSPNEQPPSTPNSRHQYKPSDSPTLSREVEYWTVFDEAAGEVYRLLVLSHIRWARKNQENQV